MFSHAVILVEYGKDYLRFMNSWGTKWGDGGFFKVDPDIKGIVF
jgi:hypothetical protein